MKRASKAWIKGALRRAVQHVGSPARGISPEYFGLSRDARDEWCCAGVALTQLAEQWGSPLHVLDVARLRDNARRFSSPGSPDLPACEVFYSYKTNPVPGVLRELHRAGVGAEVISHYELWLALELGVAPSKIVYNGPAKSPESIRMAVERDIALLNLNHREEIEVVSRIAAELGRRARVGLRVSMTGWAGQFGTPAARGEALSAFAQALASPHLEVVGLHVHRGGMMRSEAEAEQLLDGVLALADELHRELRLELGIIDLGGSIASPSVRGLGERELRLNRTLLRELAAPDPAPALRGEVYTRLVAERISAHFRAAGRVAPRIFLEPGRALSSDAQILLTRVVGLKAQDELTFAILDAGINVAESCRAEYHQVFALQRDPSRSTQIYTLVGPICTPADTLRWAVRLPQLRLGDTLAIMDAGAYFVPFSTSFSFPRPGIVMVEDGNVTSLRRAETFDDLLRLDAAAVSGA
jgi:diaminopimelate decarboxylase